MKLIERLDYRWAATRLNLPNLNRIIEKGSNAWYTTSTNQSRDAEHKGAPVK